MDSSNLKKTLKAIDALIATKCEAIKRGEMLIRLKQNSDFNELILSYCLETEAKELFEILTDPTGASPYEAEVIQLKLSAVSYLKGILGTESFTGSIEIAAKQAPLDIAREEDYRKEVTADYAVNGDN